MFKESDPASIPWGKLGVDIVLECTGAFRDRAKAAGHIKAGASKVVIVRRRTMPTSRWCWA